jgi:hypothetical protein
MNTDQIRQLNCDKTGGRMSTKSLFRLGAIATLLTALGYFIGEALYLFGNVQTLFFAWYFVIVSVFQVFAYFALYAAQAKRGDIFLFIGFVLSIIGLLYSFMDSERRLALRTGVITDPQLALAGQNTSFAVLIFIGNASILLGWVLFGIGVIRSGIFPRWAGILMMLTGVAMFVRDFFIFEYFFAVLSTAAYGWLGWSLWRYAGEIKDGP